MCKDLLCSTWNSAQCYVAAWMGGEFGGEWIHYMNGWVPLLFTWNYHNIGDWLYPNTKLEGFSFFFKKKKKKQLVNHNCSDYPIIQHLEVQLAKRVFWCTQRTKWAPSIPFPHTFPLEIQSLAWAPFSRDKRAALTIMCPRFLPFTINYHIYFLKKYKCKSQKISLISCPALKKNRSHYRRRFQSVTLGGISFIKTQHVSTLWLTQLWEQKQ